MRLLIIAIITVALIISVNSCKSSSSAPKTFCDTACLKDTLKFSGTDKLKPFVYLSSKDCKADSIIWSHSGLESNRKTGFTYLLGTTVNINKDYIRCFFKEADAAWLLFNDCVTGRGFQIKLPYDKTQSFALKSSGINSLDPKFSVAEKLVVNTDRGNIYVEDVATGKKAMMTFGEKLPINYDMLHDHIDSVNITEARIWVKIKIGEAWKEMEKKITLE
ncbi:MAG: hypothetical protein ABIU11_04590 [Chitinophagaceae bacterium]